MSESSHQNFQTSKKHSGLLMVFGLLGISLILSIFLFFVYRRSETDMAKNFAEMQKIGHTLTIEGCIQKNMEWYKSCDALQQLCDQSVSQMMRICLVNGNKNSQCTAYGNEIYGYNFGAKECVPYFSQKNLKKACADTYQSVADFCKAVRKIP